MQRFRGSACIKKIEFALYHEREIRYAVREAKTGATGYTGGTPSGHAYVADPTAVQAIKNLDELREVEFEDGAHVVRRLTWPERWIKLMDLLHTWAGDVATRGVLHDRYKGIPYQTTCIDYSISHSWYTKLLDKIRMQSLLYAVQLGLVKVF